MVNAKDCKGDKRKMNEEELFCKLFPEYAVNGKPLSPYFDLFESGYEQVEKENASLKDALEGYKQNAKWCDKCDKIAELEKKIKSLEGNSSLHEGILWNDIHNQDKKIADLEKENKVLAQNLEDTEIINNALEKENAELKARVENQKSFLKVIKAKFVLGKLEVKEIEGYLESDQLTKAIGIIKRWYETNSSACIEPSQELIEVTEQFISEVEND